MVSDREKRVVRTARRYLAGACFWLAWIGAGLPAGPALAQGVYMEPDAFLAEVFDGEVPAPGVLWLDAGLRDKARAILGHEYAGLRVRYWTEQGRSAWILDEIGKERPITTGLVIEDGRIRRVEILIFRESRGWEVRYPFFTEQFRGVGLDGGRELDRAIDNVTGATLSVNAIRKLARLALMFDQARRHSVNEAIAGE